MFVGSQTVVELTLADGISEPDGRRTRLPLLLQLTERGSRSMRALSLFNRRSTYANATGDRLVPWYTSSFGLPAVDLARAAPVGPDFPHIVAIHHYAPAAAAAATAAAADVPPQPTPPVVLPVPAAVPIAALESDCSGDDRGSSSGGGSMRRRAQASVAVAAGQEVAHLESWREVADDAMPLYRDEWAIADRIRELGWTVVAMHFVRRRRSQLSRLAHFRADAATTAATATAAAAATAAATAPLPLLLLASCLLLVVPRSEGGDLCDSGRPTGPAIG